MIIISKELGSEFSCMTSCIEEYNAGNKDLIDYMHYVVSELEECKNRGLKSYYKYLLSVSFFSLFYKKASLQPLLELSKKELKLFKEWVKLLSHYIKKVKKSEDYTYLNTVNLLLLGNDSLDKVSEYVKYFTSIQEDREIHIGNTYYLEQKEHQKEIEKNLKIMKSITMSGGKEND